MRCFIVLSLLKCLCNCWRNVPAISEWKWFLYQICFSEVTQLDYLVSLQMLFESDAVCIFHEQYPSATSRFLFFFFFFFYQARMSFICHIHNYTEYNEEFSAFNPSKCTHLEQWAADCAAPGEQSWTSCRSRDSNRQPWVTSGFKSNALSIRPTTAHFLFHWAVKNLCYTRYVQYDPLLAEYINTKQGLKFTEELR